MKLYYSSGSCSMSPHIVMRELGLKFSLEPVDLKTGKFKGGDFKTINPKGYVPVLETDSGEVLSEGVAIVQYLADQKPEMKLIPKAGTMERYRCQEWLNFISTEMHKGFSPLWRDTTPEPYKNMTKETLFTRFDYLDKHFSKNDYLMGTQFTVADAYLFTVMSWSKHLKLDLSRWKALEGFMGRISKRPAVQETMKAEGLLA